MGRVRGRAAGAIARSSMEGDAADGARCARARTGERAVGRRTKGAPLRASWSVPRAARPRVRRKWRGPTARNARTRRVPAAVAIAIVSVVLPPAVPAGRAGRAAARAAAGLEARVLANALLDLLARVRARLRVVPKDEERLVVAAASCARADARVVRERDAAMRAYHRKGAQGGWG